MDAFTYRITKAIAGGMNLLAATACGQESSSYVHRRIGRKIEKRIGTEYHVIRL